MRAASIVLVLAVLTHNLYAPLAAAYWPQATRRAEQELFYVFQGVSVLVLSLLALQLAKPRDRRVQALLLGAVVYSAAEQALVVACGAAWLLQLGVADVGAAQLCSRTTGWHSWLAPLVVLLSILLWRLRRAR